MSHKNTVPRELVVAVFNSLQDAQAAFDRLSGADFPDDQLSLVTSENEPALADAQATAAALKHGDKSENRAAKGTGIGALVGALAAAPIVAITAGTGAVLLAGPIAMGLTGAVVGGLTGAMQGWGIQEDHVEHYSQLVEDGSVLILAHGDPQETARAATILRETSSQATTIHAKTSADEVDE